MRNNFRLMLLSMATLGLFSCADKLTDETGPNQSQNGNTEGCVTFKISYVGSQASLSRATRGDDDDENPSTNNEFSAGDAGEYAITSDAGANVVFLFNASKQYQGRSDLQVVSDPNSQNSATGNDTGHTNTDGEIYFNARIRKAKETGTWPFVMILNANPDELKKLDLTEGVTTLEQFLQKTSDLSNSNPLLGQYKATDNKTYFTMSNTVYVEDVKDEAATADAASSTENTKKIQNYFEISDSKIYTTTIEAAKDPIVVHVERVAAKFGLKYNSQDVTTSQQLIQIGSETTTDGKSNKLYVLESADVTDEVHQRVWAVKILGWDVNGRETSTYWVKNLLYTPTSGSTTLSTVFGTDGKIGNWVDTFDANNKGWNDPTRVRSYWAVDPHYNTGRYPEQYREAKNVADGEIVYGTDEDNDALQYISYSKIGELGQSAVYRYAPENTFDGLSFMTKTSGNTNFSYQGDGYKRASTHILVAAQLLIADSDEATTVTDPTTSTADDGTTTTAPDIYCYENIYWVDKTTSDSKNGKEELVKYMVNNILTDYKTTLYVESETPNEMVALSAADANTYFGLTAATIKGGDGRVMLTLKSDAKVYRYVAADDGTYKYEQIGQNDESLFDVIYKAGTAKHYKEGKMYYAIPIKHMVPVQAATAATETSQATPHYYNTGSYGVVRNHWYNVNISSIKVPGTPVDNPDQPIIPNDDPDEGGYIAFEIVIIPWHIINQDVEF